MNECEKWPYRDVITAAEKMGANVESKSADDVCADFKNMIFYTHYIALLFKKISSN